MIVAHNLYALNTNRMNGIIDKKYAKIAERLSSGYRINRAADDAAGLAISEKMRRQIRGLSQASANAQDGISLAQSAEGALNEMHEVVQRGNELAVKAANGTLTDDERAMVDEEIQQLKEALNEAAHNTEFNTIKLFPENGASPKSVERSSHYEIKYQIKEGTFTVASQINPAEGDTDAAGEAGQVLADKIANELVPNAVKQILDAFPALQAAVGSDTIEMALDVSYLDGPSNTLAYAQCFFYATGKPINFLIKVDTSDFSDEDALGTGANAEVLESTIAHELMHSVMQYTMTDGMTGRNNSEEFPTWFTEGTAQLSGGGYTTGWNDMLTYLTSSLADENDTTSDSQIMDYLNNYTVAGRPYGHGYLASAYLGYLANGGAGEITSSAIANGMNKIFADIIGGSSFNDALVANTGLTEGDIENLFASGDAELVDFVRKLSYLTGDGAGSVVSASLGVGGTNILGDTAPEQQFKINSDQIKVDTGSGQSLINLQIGAEADVKMEVKLYQMDAAALGLEDTNVKTQRAAGDAINQFTDAIERISKVRSYYGAVQNRLEHAIANLDNVVENTTAAESAIRDTDMAKEMVELTTNSILKQAGQVMLVQANRQPEFILNLLS